MMKKIAAIVLLIMCSILLHACNSGTSNPSDNENYEKMFTSFKELAEGFDKDASLGGYDTNEYFVRLASELETLLVERASIENLNEDAKSLDSGESGFTIVITEPEKIGDTYYRFVELSNMFNDTLIGTINPLYLQYWAEDTIGLYQLSVCTTNSGETTSFIDYRIIQDKYISVIELRRSDIVSEGEIENCVPKNNINTDNGFWEIALREFHRHGRDASIGIMLYELGNEDNKDKTAIEINDYGVTVTNIENPAQTVTLAIIHDEWRIQ